jgi:predicted DNA-binding transcriptional regulator AlpA
VSQVFESLHSLMTEKEVDAHYGIGVPKLRRHRLERTGPNYLKLNRLVRYRKDDIEAAREKARSVPEKEKAKPPKIATPWLRTREARGYLGMSNSCFWAKVKDDPEAPQPHRMGGIVLWSKAELQAWVESK